MDGKKAIKLLEQSGWRHVRTRRSHHVMKKPGEKND